MVIDIEHFERSSLTVDIFPPYSSAAVKTWDTLFEYFPAWLHVEQTKIKGDRPFAGVKRRASVGKERNRRRTGCPDGSSQK